jgi:hypothetical protein
MLICIQLHLVLSPCKLLLQQFRESLPLYQHLSDISVSREPQRWNNTMWWIIAIQSLEWGTFEGVMK